MESTARPKNTEHTNNENGDCLAKLPAATADQLNIAKLLFKPGDDTELRRKVAQIRELTECTEDQAVTALYDCENNLERAVGLLLDKFRCGIEEEWHTTGKKPRQKHVSESGFQEPTAEKLYNDRVLSIKNGYVAKKDQSGRGDSSTHAKSNKIDEDSLTRRKDNRVRHIHGTAKSDPIEQKEEETKTGSRSTVNDYSKNAKSRAKISSTSDGWDPYTEYGEWGGEAIEIVNSNSTIACDMPVESVLPDGLFVETESNGSKPIDDLPEDVEGSPGSELFSMLANVAEQDTLFISKAVSKAPPPAFRNLSDVPVFIIPDLLPDVSSQWRFKFNGEHCSPLRHLEKTVIAQPHAPNEHLSEHPQINLTIGTKSPEPQGYSPYVPPAVCNPSSTMDLNKSPGARSLLKNPTQTSDISDSTFSTDHYQNAAVTTKVFSSAAKGSTNTVFDSQSANGQSDFLESSLKNYILESLPSEMNKLSVSDSSALNTKSQFSLQTSVTQTQPPTNPAFPHQQGSNVTAMQHQLNKTVLPHNSLHGSQQPLVSSASQTHHQQATALPPGIPPFISQFAPPAYHMFNLSGGSGNAPALFDIDQLQLLQQQQRMLYDMHLQQQAATTAQTLLTSSSEAQSTAKSVTHTLPGTLNHVTAANAGIRPDMLASAMGHAPQMMPPGPPYFSIPGYVLMNGYANAFLNQQQQSAQDSSQAQGQRHTGSPITQHQQQQPPNSQSYTGIKSGNTGVSGYEDLFDMKYGDPNKQVGFKNSANQPNFNSFQGQILAADNFGGKMSTGAHSTGGMLPQGFNAGSGAASQPFSPQFYPTSSHLTAAALAVAAAAAASAQQQSSNNAGSGVVNPSNTVGPTGAASNQGGGGTPNPNQLHLSGNPNQSMVMSSSGQTLHHHHHQRPVMPHQH